MMIKRAIFIENKESKLKILINTNISMRRNHLQYKICKVLPEQATITSSHDEKTFFSIGYRGVITPFPLGA